MAITLSEALRNMIPVDWFQESPLVIYPPAGLEARAALADWLSRKFRAFRVNWRGRRVTVVNVESRADAVGTLVGAGNENVNSSWNDADNALLCELYATLGALDIQPLLSVRLTLHQIRGHARYLGLRYRGPRNRKAARGKQQCQP